MRQNHKIVKYAGMILLVACSADRPAAPDSGDAEAAGVRATVTSTYAEDGKSAIVMVTPSGGWFQIGTHGVWFPENSICDPATSSYGPTVWDEPCETIQQPIEIHAKIMEQGGLPYVVFTPDLRFAPAVNEKGGLDPKRFVKLYMYVGDSELARSGSLEIKWVSDDGAVPVSEAEHDPSMRTRRMLHGQLLYRRVKHFSGYLVAAGALSDANEVY